MQRGISHSVLIARKFLILIVSLFLFLLPTEAMPVYAQNQRTTLQIDTAGINYLTANYNTTVGLVRNSPDSVSLQNSYYLFSDNYLVALAFWSFPAQNASLTNQAENISKTTTTYLKRLPYAPNQYEALTSNVATFAGSKDYLLNKTG